MAALGRSVGTILLAGGAIVGGIVGCRPSTNVGRGGPAGDPATEVSDIQGQVVIDGSSTVYPIAETANADFGKAFPEVKVSIGFVGTGGGFEKFGRGETDITNASRPIKVGEREVARAAKIDFIELPVAYDGITIVVHPSNDWIKDDTITLDTLRAIFVGEPKRWKDVDPSWPDEPLKIHMPDEKSGTYEYFHEAVAEKKPLRGDPAAAQSSDDGVLVTGVANDKWAIGFFGASYYFENKGRLKALKVVDPATGQAVAVSPESIERGEYAPLSRPLFMYVKRASVDRVEVRSFLMNFFDHPEEIVKAAGAVPLPPELYDRAVDHLDRGLTGTHYVDKDGRPRHGPLAEVYVAENVTP